MTASDRVDVVTDVAAARARIAEAHEWVGDLCSGKRRWQMRVPADQSDSDITISDALQIGEKALDEVERLRAALQAVAHLSADNDGGVLDRIYVIAHTAATSNATDVTRIAGRCYCGGCVL